MDALGQVGHRRDDPMVLQPILVIVIIFTAERRGRCGVVCDGSWWHDPASLCVCVYHRQTKRKRTRKQKKIPTSSRCSVVPAIKSTDLLFDSFLFLELRLTLRFSTAVRYLALGLALEVGLRVEMDVCTDR